MPWWDINFLEDYSCDCSVVFFRVDHTFADGVGIISLISCLLDNEFRIKMKKKFEPLSLLWQIIYTVTGQYHLNLLIIREWLMHADPSASKMSALTKEQKSENIHFVSEEFDFGLITK